MIRGDAPIWEQQTASAAVAVAWARLGSEGQSKRVVRSIAPEHRPAAAADVAAALASDGQVDAALVWIEEALGGVADVPAIKASTEALAQVAGQAHIQTLLNSAFERASELDEGTLRRLGFHHVALAAGAVPDGAEAAELLGRIEQEIAQMPRQDDRTKLRVVIVEAYSIAGALEPALERADGIADPNARARAYGHVAAALMRARDEAGALELVERGLALATGYDALATLLPVAADAGDTSLRSAAARALELAHHTDDAFEASLVYREFASSCARLESRALARETIVAALEDPLVDTMSQEMTEITAVLLAAWARSGDADGAADWARNRLSEEARFSALKAIVRASAEESDWQAARRIAMATEDSGRAVFLSEYLEVWSTRHTPRQVHSP